MCESDEDYFVESFQKLFHSIDSEFSSRRICNLSSFIKISQLDPQWEYIKDYHNGTQHPAISDSIIRKLYHSIWIFKKKLSRRFIKHLIILSFENNYHLPRGARTRKDECLKSIENPILLSRIFISSGMGGIL